MLPRIVPDPQQIPALFEARVDSVRPGLAPLIDGCGKCHSLITVRHDVIRALQGT